MENKTLGLVENKTLGFAKNVRCHRMVMVMIPPR
jgi:hypothetical protein